MQHHKIRSYIFGLIFSIFCSNTFATVNSIVAVDTSGTTGQYTSMALDASGNPIISYYNATQGKLKVVHCFDKNCAKFDAILTPDPASNIGEYTSLALDNNGNPVVSYYDKANTALKVLHCGNTSCSTANTIATPDSTGVIGQYTSVTVDSSNKPYVSYYDVNNGLLKILHCGNAACSAGNVIVTPDVSSSNGVQSSIKINSQGKPVIAYFDFTHSSLKLLSCGNANCTSGNTITTVDSGNNVGRFPALLLDNTGNPVISYLDLTNYQVKVVRCGNTTCTAGKQFSVIKSKGNSGYYTSLALDANNKPIVSSYDSKNKLLTILTCGNTTCTANNSIQVPDSGYVGLYSSMKLDANGNPVVSYYDSANGNLNVLHCTNKTCNANSTVIADSAANVGRYSSIKLDNNGFPVVSYYDEANGDLKLVHCGNALCTLANSITAPDTTGNTGWDTSLQIDVNGYPVISLYDLSNNMMKLLHCINKNCTGVSSVAKPDVLAQRNTSMALDASGYPVIATTGQQDQGLRMVHCGNANCTMNNVMSSPDYPVFPFMADVRGVSMKLDAVGNPVVSFYRADQQQFKILHCVDQNCSGANSIVTIDAGAQPYDHRSTSLTLDENGYPVVAYQDIVAQSLKLLHCGNANCTSGNSITVVAQGANVGFEPSVQMNKSGYPVISYGAPNGMTVARCNNANCTSRHITPIDVSTTGDDTALALDALDYPVVSFYDSTLTNLKVTHCGSEWCQ